MRKKIAVLGTGANGASIAADLTRAGLDVVLIDQWPDHVEAMRTNGVRIEMAEETLQVPVRAYHLCDVATFSEPFDIVLLVIKAYDTRWACRLIEPYLKDDGLLAGVQNGMTIDTIADVVGPERTMGCVIEITSQMFEPGIVQRESGPDRSWFAVGSIHEATRGREGEIQELLAQAGTAEITDDIRSMKWMKLISNCTTLATTAIFGATMVDAANDPAMRDVMLRSGMEALRAGQDMGYSIQPIFGLDEEDLRNSNHLVDYLLDAMTGTFVTPNTITTVLQDHIKGRKSEVEDVNGWVVAEQEKRGKTAPVNAAIVEISARIEQGEIKPGPDNLRLLDQLVTNNGTPIDGRLP